jgi:hypothetical protein
VAYRFLAWFLGVVTRVFFRQVDIAGIENIPATGPVLSRGFSGVLGVSSNARPVSPKPVLPIGFFADAIYGALPGPAART